MNLKTIPLSEIDQGMRFREDYGDLESLKDSIKESGLISPIAVKAQSDGRYLLLAGGRRFRAMELAGIEECPCRIYDEDLTEDQIRVIELSENFYRKDLSWIEVVKLKREIHRLQQSIFGAKNSTSPDAEGWSMADTAKLTGYSKSSISQDISLADAVDAFPDLFTNVKSKYEASKVASKLSETIIKEELSRRIQKEQAGTPLMAMAKSFIVKDFFEGVKVVPDESINFIEVDPPYGIDLREIKSGGREVTEGYNEIKKDDYPNFLSRVLSECYRTLKNNSYLICWFGPEPWFESVYQLIIKAGFDCNRLVGIWTRGFGQSHRPDSHLANAYEMFFWARKGTPMLNRPGSTNIFNHPAVAAQNKIHPTEKPLALMEEIYQTFTPQGSRIMIPFLGSGNGILAARNVGMTAFGFELTRAYYDSFLVRLSKGV